MKNLCNLRHGLIGRFVFAILVSCCRVELCWLIRHTIDGSGMHEGVNISTSAISLVNMHMWLENGVLETPR